MVWSVCPDQIPSAPPPTHCQSIATLPVPSTTTSSARTNTSTSASQPAEEDEEGLLLLPSHPFPAFPPPPPLPINRCKSQPKSPARASERASEFTLTDWLTDERRETHTSQTSQELHDKRQSLPLFVDLTNYANAASSADQTQPTNATAVKFNCTPPLPFSLPTPRHTQHQHQRQIFRPFDSTRLDRSGQRTGNGSHSRQRDGVAPRRELSQNKENEQVAGGYRERKTSPSTYILVAASATSLLPYPPHPRPKFNRETDSTQLRTVDSGLEE